MENNKLSKTIGKKHTRQNTDELPDDWVSASHTRNYVLNDPCLDYFEMYNIEDINDKQHKRIRTDNSYKKPESYSLSLLFEKGRKFEENIINVIRIRFPNALVKICESYQARSKELCRKTVEHMIKGIPFIYQAVLHNSNNHTLGCVDLLVRSDWLNKLTVMDSLADTDHESPNLGHNNFHYVVVDIKSSRLQLNKDKLTIRNQPNIKSYKSQLFIYNQALGELQGYTPKYAFILCHSVFNKKSVNKVMHTFSADTPWYQLCRIDYTDIDKPYEQITKKAVNWLHKLQTTTNLEHDPPSIPQLYPNMKNSMDGKYHHVKKQIADKYGEITSVWNCGVEQRRNAFMNGIKTWRDKRLCANILGLTGKTGRVVDMILDINHQNRRLIQPKKLANTEFKKYIGNSAGYVDVETVPQYLNVVKGYERDFVFMIGLGFYKNNKWKYIPFFVKELTEKEETSIFERFMKTIEKNKVKYLFHYGIIEQLLFQKLNNGKFKLPDMINFYNIIVSEPVVVKDALDFGLKSIGTAMWKNKLITSSWENCKIKNGIEAMEQAIKIYLEQETTYTKQDIADYNEMDCKVLADIVKYLNGKN